MPIEFGDFTLDDERRQLLRDGEAVRLSPKAFQLLSILVHDAPRAVSKTDLQDKLWPGTFVTEGNLATLATEVRSALNDDAREPRFIRTLYGFGYSFVAPLRESQPVSPSPPRARRFGHLTTAAAFGAVAVILILASRSTIGSAPAPAQTRIRSIAVLPFDISGADRTDTHLGLGLPDLLITRLTNVREVVVRPTSAIREFEGKQSDAESIGRKLKVDAVVEGSVRTSPDRIRVTVQLLDVRDNKPIWADRFDEKRSDIFSIEDSLSTKLAEALRLQLTPDEKTLLGKRFTSNPDAYQDYIQARYHLEQFGSGSGHPYSDEANRAIEFFQNAARKDPGFAAAWAGMSHAYLYAGHYGRWSHQQALIAARNAAQKALDLDASLSEAYATLGGVKANLDFDFESALRLYNKALELNPRDTYALLTCAYLVQAHGRFDQAIALSKRLVEIDPVSPDNQWRLANAYLTSGQNDLAAKQVQVVLGMDPGYAEAHIALVRLAIDRGDFDAAIAEARTQAAIPGNERALGFLGYALARAGRRAEALKVLQQLRGQENLQAFIYAGLGNVDSMMTLLEKSVDDRTQLRLKTEPIFLPYHSNPRFIALLRRAGFKE